MPHYIFVCERCKKDFDVCRPMSQHADPFQCEQCQEKCFRDFAKESAVCIPPTKTLGSLADKNGGKFSNDYKRKLNLDTKGRKSD